MTFSNRPTPLEKCGSISESLVEEFCTFIADWDLHDVRADFGRVCDASLETLFDASYAASISAIIEKAICARQPFSAVRIGDGEGNLLKTYCDSFPRLTDFSVNRILRLMFGRANFARNDVYAIQERTREAILNSDIVGIPDIARLTKSFSRAVEMINTNSSACDFRGHSGTVSAIKILARMLRQNRRLKYTSNCFLHKDLLPYYNKLLSRARFIGIIGCHPELEELIKGSFRPARCRLWRIPNQALNLGKAPSVDHFPDVFFSLLQELDVEERGDVFLVGAGILGNIYVDYLKRKGGIAINIGSVADVWVGASSRGYHNDKFVARWALPARRSDGR